MPRGAAREEGDLFDGPQVGGGDRHFIEKHLARLERDPAEHRVAHGVGLLEDLLQHEVRVAGFFGRDGVPGDPRRAALHGLSVESREPGAGRGDDGHLAVVEKNDVASVAEDGRHVRRDEGLALTDADDDRRTVADGDE